MTNKMIFQEQYTIAREILQDNILMLVYLAPMLIISLVYFYYKNRVHRKSVQVLEESIQDGMMQPASLHPIINHNRCIGCRACNIACPESHNNVLGMINHKAVLINPAACIGHGPCKDVCPVDAITLVFGTEERGVDIPHVAPDFETNVPGVFIAGEIGGMGLIHNAINQGVQAMDSIHKLVKDQTDNELDVVIVGAGPAGIAASLAAMKKKLKFKTIEQDSLGGVVAHYPRGKLVMTAPVNLPLEGQVDIKETTKEDLLAFWQQVVDKTGLKINFNERVKSVTTEGTGFRVTNENSSLKTKAVLLAIGRQGTPRKLDVPGEDQNKVVYRLIDSAQYKNMHVLVVGGGDSALEAAHSLADEDCVTVSLSYRGDAFNRAKGKNRKKIEAAVASGKLNVYFNSKVKKIEKNAVSINYKGEDLNLENEAVIICAGGVLPTGFLSDIGIKYETKYGTV
jgi:thioredoxin reductase